MITYGNMVEPQ